MKFKTLVSAVLLVVAATAAHAANTSTIGVNGGLTIPTGDLGDAVGIGFHIGGEYTYMVNENVGVGGDLAYHKFGSKDVTVGAYTISSELSTIQYTAHGKLFFPTQSEMKPYLKLGLGMYTGKAKVSSNIPGAIEGEDSSTDFGINFGVGADWKINESMSWGGNAAYHTIDGDALLTVSAGLRWGMGK